MTFAQNSDLKGNVENGCFGYESENARDFFGICVNFLRLNKFQGERAEVIRQIIRVQAWLRLDKEGMLLHDLGDIQDNKKCGFQQEKIVYKMEGSSFQQFGNKSEESNIISDRQLLMGKGKLILTNEDNQSEQIKQQQFTQTKKINKKKNKKKKHHQSSLIENIQPQPFQQEIVQQSHEQQKKIKEHQNNHQEALESNAELQPQEQNQKIKLKHLAIALPESILQLPQTSQLRAYFISEVARISSIFKVDQIIVLKDHSYVSKSEAFHPAEYMARNLQYLETPQYLRKHLFKLHADLKNAGLMNPIQCHHHLLTTQPSEFRQGVALDRPVKKGSGSWVDIGLKKQARMDQLVLPLTRVTLKLKNWDDPDPPFYEAEAVSKKVPRIQHGLYWGYDVRIAKNLPDMFNASKSLLGQEDYNIKLLCNHTKETYSLPEIEHFYQIQDQLQDSSMLIFFSGTDDLSTFVQKDAKSKISKEDAIEMFDCCMRFDGFGVKKLRIEEQLFITLSKVCQYTY